MSPDPFTRRFNAWLAWKVRATHCPTCREIGFRGFGPSHDGSRNCESGSLASGGDRSHCTCDWCF